ncbi:fasciclin domain-containing protein [Actinomarinicola tropica]|uniref:Fasciclin domain-containing protein n=1 Tax=Actinomarinicola tropica TaxID=2789776 RepID=A0A5Q2RGK8_9ACTN|nr:fasciclin domain-containing protein [Actinomarinicola tropica]QGG95948.1 fasciclin domain-containing protein [Actinomarinicola tropica]
MNRRTMRLSAGVVAAALLLAACGDDDGDDASDAPATEQTESTEATETTEEMSESTDEDMSDDEMAGDDIVDTAVAAGSFETLVTAVQAAGLEETLRGEGPFTVFAPTDDAFAALPEGTLDTLLEDPEGDLADILTYHVVEGEVLAADVVELDGQEVTTVNGATFTVNVGDDGSVSLTDAAGNTVNVVQTDIETSNGVIHVLDGVLLPG